MRRDMIKYIVYRCQACGQEQTPTDGMVRPCPCGNKLFDTRYSHQEWPKKEVKDGMTRLDTQGD